MGNALVVMVVPEEMLPTQALCTRDPKTGKPRKVHPDGSGWIPAAKWAALLRKHPDAFWPLDVPRTAVWQLPVEPRASRQRWYDDPKLVAKHRRAVHESLEAFVNEHLAQLDGMVRTGWWIVRQARVRVASMEGVPPKQDMKGDRAEQAARLLRGGFTASEVAHALEMTTASMWKLLGTRRARADLRAMRGRVDKNTNVDELPLSVRSFNALQDAHVTRLGELLDADCMDRVRARRNVGRITIAELDEIARTLLVRGLPPSKSPTGRTKGRAKAKPARARAGAEVDG
jgi:hypothetical protein